jgi:hypothetical protein
VVVTVFNATFANLNGNGTIKFIDQNTSDVGLALFVDSFDTASLIINATAPALPLPKAIVDAIIDKIVNAICPTLNNWLALHPFLLPERLAPLAPHPILSAQNEGTHSNFYFC